MPQFLGSGYPMGNGQITVWDGEHNPLFLPQFGWGYRNTGPQAVAWQWENLQRWPYGIFLSGSPDIPLSPMAPTYYEPWSLGTGGKSRPWFLRGTCKDVALNALGGAVVQAFITSTDAFVAEAQCDSAGYYQVPCQLLVPHYLVAYYPGSPDLAGATVNTLIPVL